LKEKQTIAELISFLLKLNPEISKQSSLFVQPSWSIDLLFPSLILKERFILQVIKSRFLNKQFANLELNKFETKDEAEEMLSNFKEIKFLVSELDNIEKKAESAFNKQSDSQTKIRFEDLIFDEERMETTRKNWRQDIFKKENSFGSQSQTQNKQNPLFLKEKLILCKERIKEKEKEIESLEKEVNELDTQKKDLEYLYGDQYLEEVFGDKEIKELQAGNEQLQNQIEELEEELKGYIGSEQEIDFDESEFSKNVSNNFFK
jgi:chromosome segregation ATPase